jgi:hypothetical protein
MVTFVSMLSPVKEHSTTSFKMTFIVFPLAIQLALFPIQQTDRTSFLEDGRVKWLTPYPNRNPNCNLNQINNKNPKRNNFRKSLGRFAGWEIVRTLVGKSANKSSTSPRIVCMEQLVNSQCILSDLLQGCSNKSDTVII